MKCYNCRLEISSEVCGRCGWVNTPSVEASIVIHESIPMENVLDNTIEAEPTSDILQEAETNVKSLVEHLF